MKKHLVVFIFFLLFLVACSQENVTAIPLTASGEQVSMLEAGIAGNEVIVAFASVVSPQQTRAKYNLLINYLENKLDRPITIVQKQTYAEVNRMLKTGEVDLAFICSLSYVIGIEENFLEGVVAPKVNGEERYQSYVITHINSEIETFEDLQGKRFAFVDPYSYSGRLSVLSMLDKRGLTVDFFEDTFFTYSHDYSVSAVARGTVDAAAVDSLLFDQLVSLNSPDAALVKIIEKGAFAGTPPVVVSKKAEENFKKDINEILRAMKDDREGIEILKELKIDEYVPIVHERYLPIKEILHLLGEER